MRRKLIAVLSVMCLLCSLGAVGCKEEKQNAVLATESYVYEDYDVKAEVVFNDAALLRVTVNGADLAPGYYTTQNGGVTIKNAYLETLEAGEYIFTAVTTLNSLQFTINVPEKAVIGEPTVKAETETVDVGTYTEDLSFVIGYNGGLLSSVKMDGIELEEEDYYVVATKLYVYSERISVLSTGVHTLEISTDGGKGTCNFTVSNPTIAVIDGKQIKKSDGEDLSYAFSLNGNAVEAVTINGVSLASSAYRWAGEELILKNEYFGLLADGFYRIGVKADTGATAYCYVVKGCDEEDVAAFDFDGLKPIVNGYGQDLNNAYETAGIEGTSGKLTTENSGTILAFGEGNIEYDFRTGITYVLSFDLKINEIKSGTSNVQDIAIPVWFTTSGEANADLGYLCYNETDELYVLKDKASDSFTLTRVGDTYSFRTEFTVKDSYGMMQVALWMKSDLLIDNILLMPTDEKQVSASETADYYVKGQGKDYEIEHKGATLLGIIDEKGEAYSEGVVSEKGKTILSANVLDNCATNDVLKLTFVTDKGKFYKEILISSYNVSVSGDSYLYEMDGKDMQFTVYSDGLAIEGVYVGDKALNEDAYTLQQNGVLTVKASELATIQSSRTYTIKFAGQPVSVEVKIRSKLQARIDFDDFLAQSGGYAVGCDNGIEENGIEGRSGKIKAERPGTLFAAGQLYSQIDFQEGKTYVLSFDFKPISVSGPNFVIGDSDVMIPITFGSGKDVAYLYWFSESNAYEIATQRISNGISSITENNGIYSVSLQFVPDAECKQLTCDIWFACEMLVDNIQIIEL